MTGVVSTCHPMCDRQHRSPSFESEFCYIKEQPEFHQLLVIMGGCLVANVHIKTLS